MQKSDLPKSLRNLNQSRETPDRNLDRVLDGMRNADRSCHKMMAIEVWAIAKTVDNIFPGFWNRFMSNRQLALKQFLEMKQAKRSASAGCSNDGSDDGDVEDDDLPDSDLSDGELTGEDLSEEELSDLEDLEHLLTNSIDASSIDASAFDDDDA
jgi:hypothetical protein